MYFGVNQTLKIKLGGAVATNQCPWVALTIDTVGAATPSNGVTNGATDVIVVAAAKGCLKWFWLRNADTAAVTLNIIYDDNGTQRIFAAVTLQVGDVLEINSMGHLQVVSSAGVIRNGGGIGGLVGAVDNRLVRVDGITGLLVQAGVDASLDDSGNLGLGLSGTMDRALQLGSDKAARGTIKALTDGATITPDFATGNFFSVTLGGSRTMANPSNLQPGQSGGIWITQPGSGGPYTLAWGSYWDFSGGTAPTLSTDANAVDYLAYAVESTTHITCNFLANRS